MLVNLTNEFRGPDGVLYKPENNPHDFPDDLVLPKSAKKLDPKEAKAVKAAATEEEEK